MRDQVYVCEFKKHTYNQINAALQSVNWKLKELTLDEMVWKLECEINKSLDFMFL